MKIGVFDSGVGGQTVASAIRKEMPGLEVIVREDKANLPYGTKTKAELIRLVTPILDSMVKEGCEVIVVACNTVTTNIITELRQTIKVPLVGIEPMIKPASNLSKTKIITVCATPATLASERYAWLKEEFAKNLTVIEPDCSRWAKMIEDNDVDKREIETVIKLALEADSDVIVLGCTHFHWIQELIQSTAGTRANILQPEEAVVKQLSKVLQQLG